MGGDGHTHHYVLGYISLMELIGEIIAYLTIKPFYSFFQALAGILQPTKSPHLIRAQRIAAVVVIAGAISVTVAIILASFGTGLLTFVIVFLAGVILLSIAGAIGHYIEKEVTKTARDDGT